VYALLIAISASTMAGRIMVVRSALGETPLLSANDRSRWSTIRALVDEGTYQIDAVIFREDGKRDREWYTIDMVRHRGWDGREHYYSSKPPLLATLLAGPYWVLRTLAGVSLADRPFYVVRLLLVVVNVLSMAVYFCLLKSLFERFGETDWGRLFAMAAATFGTFLTTFAVTLNNHLPAAISVLAAVYLTLRIVCDEGAHFGHYFGAGLFAAFAATNELPALSFLGLLTLVLLGHNIGKTVCAFAPAALIVTAAFFGTNYGAHGSWRPPYAHRHDGPVIAELGDDVAADAIVPGAIPGPIRERLVDAGVQFSDAAVVEPSAVKNRWHLFDPANEMRYAFVATAGGLEVRQWENWYEYERSYWLPGRKSGVDLGEKSRAVYAFHIFAGHRGIFSLTPVWLLSLAGGGAWLLRGSREQRVFALCVLVLTVVCLSFYLRRPLADRNYGGVAAGFRWMFWFTPLWLLCLLPAADWAGRRRWSRALALSLLAVSIFSAAYPGLNPWSHSWIFDYWSELGWIKY
jgi:hypothetical protein